MGFGVVANQWAFDESVAIDNFSLKTPTPSTDDSEENS